MKARKLSLLVIIITTFCVCAMLYSSKMKVIEGNKKNETNNITKDNNLITKNNSLKSNNESGKSNDKNAVGSTEGKKINKPSIKNTVDSSENKNSNNVKNNLNQESDSENNNQNSSNKKEIAVFKVSKGEIKDMLSLSDILRIESIAGKLSGTDFTRVKQYLQEGDDESVIKALKLLKERLSDKDYEKFKAVASKFINLEVIEGE